MLSLLKAKYPGQSKLLREPTLCFESTWIDHDPLGLSSEIVSKNPLSKTTKSFYIAYLALVVTGDLKCCQLSGFLTLAKVNP